MTSTTLKLTVAQYDAMVEKGAFEELPQKIELIHGEIHALNPAGPVHDDLIQYLTNWSVRNTDATEVGARIQSGLRLLEQESRPEPDVLWVRADRPRGRHPEAGEVLLVIEVADSSLRVDRTVKADLYAQAGIAEYWIVSGQDREVHVLRDPGRHGYASMVTIRPGDFATPLVAPNANLNVAELFAVG